MSEFAISIHTPAWGVTCGRSSRERQEYFNPHPRVGGDTLLLITPPILLTYFNPHPRVGGDGTGSHSRAHSYRNFNPHPRVGGDRKSSQKVGFCFVYITQFSIISPQKTHFG